MSMLFGTAHRLGRGLLYLGMILLLLAALLLAAGRLLSPWIDGYRADIEAGISAYLGTPVQIQRAELSWRGWTPTLRLDGLSLSHPQNPILQSDFKQAWVTPAVLDSLVSRRLRLRHLRLEGSRLVMQAPAATHTSLPDRLQAQASWLLSVRSLDVIFQEWELRNEDSADPPLVFQDARLSLRGRQHSRQLALSLRLPDTLGDSLQAAAVWQGEAREPATWQIHFYLRGDGLKPAGWPLPVKPMTGWVKHLELWGDWQAQTLQTLRGRLATQDLRLPAPVTGGEPGGTLSSVTALALDFSWRRYSGGWYWRSDWTGTGIKGNTVLHSGVDLTVSTSPESRLRYLEGRCRDLRLQDLSAVVLPWLKPTQRKALAELNPRGQVPELQFRLPLDEQGIPLPLQQARQEGGYALAVRGQNLALQSWQTIPAIQGLSGQLVLDQDGGRLDLETQGLQLDAGRLWREVLRFDSLRGALRWHREATGLNLESAGITLSKGAFNTRLQGKLTLPDDGSSPLVDATLQVRELDLAQVRQYLPAAIMEPGLVDWLDRALVGGRLPAGEVTLRGRLAEFPFAQGQGLFETRLRLVNTTLDYDPAWPRLEQLDAEVLFRNNRFQLESTKGRILNAEIERVRAEIAALEQPILTVQGQATGPGATLLQVLRESPLAAKTETYVKDMEVTGNTKLDLNLRIPVDPRPNTVQGTVYFAGNNNLTLRDWNLELQRIQGTVGFTDTGLSAKDIRLWLRGEPMRLDIATEPGSAGRTLFTVRGPLNLRTLAGDKADLLDPYLQGQGQGQLVLAVPPGKGDEVSLTLTSDLKGIEVKLPEPLGKSAAGARPLELQARIDRAAKVLQLRLAYAPHTQAVLEFSDFFEQPRFRRGELRIDRGQAQLPKTAGLTVSAALPRLVLSDIVQPSGDVAGALSWLRELDLHIGELRLGQQAFTQVAVNATQEDNALRVQLDSQAIAGHLVIPLAQRGAPLTIDLHRLALTLHEPPTEAASSYDPRALPPLRVNVEDLSLNGNSLGQLQLVTVPQVDGLRLNELRLNSEVQQLTASGDWRKTAAGSLSRLQAQWNSRDLGKALQALGYSASLEGGKMEAELKVNWPASLLDFAPELLQGSLRLHLTDGRLPEVEPGVGRLVGLINLFSLVRRLQLDFSDLFGPGLSFDVIDGTFQFDNGQAHNTVDMEIPAAQVQLAGSIDFTTRSYRQRITVTPQITTPLAIAGALAGSPVVGAAVLVAGQILKPGIDRLTRYHYSIKGSWDNPVIERTEALVGTESASPPLELDR